MDRRQFLGAAACATATLAATGLAPSAWAADWPSRPIRLVVAYPPGGGTDVVARLFADYFTKVIGQSVVVENKPGGATIPATQDVIRAKNDGHTLLVTLGSSATSGAHINRVPYDPLTDLTALAELGKAPVVMVANKDAPFSTLKELIAWSKANPGKPLHSASYGPGTSSHFGPLLFNRLSGTHIEPVLYKGSAPATQDLVGGVVPLMIDGLTTGVPLYQAGKTKVLATTIPERSELAPGSPTFRELGFPEMEQLSGYFALFGPKAMPKDTVEAVSAAVRKVLADPAYHKRLAGVGVLPPQAVTPEAFATQIKTDHARWGKFIKDIGFKIDGT
ncbi:Extra-cytoplasmic solute receptor [Cupriavidus sp. H18C1]|uniref:Bug family tripartite tricarboxylate transporter substrate binding protein n=1 Tax=Cupriavidus sp. H18C1 TaxID=3241601 RepID=UPI003BB99086